MNLVTRLMFFINMIGHHICSQFHKQIHAKALRFILKVAKYFLRYFKGIIDVGLIYQKGEKLKFTCFNDVDYGENLDIRKSISNDFFLIGIILIPYIRKIQGFENKYFTKLEYRTFMEVAKET